MPSFLADICQTEELNFFHSGSYGSPSYSQSWTTRTIPDVEGITTPVYLQVLEKFKIPVDSSQGLPPGGTLPGIDIKRMDAIQAIKLSLAEALIVGQWWEVYEDGEGGVFFEKVFDNGSPGKSINLNVRLCVPAASKSNEVDMVIVHGYQFPPERFALDFREVVPAGTGTINPTNVTGSEKLFTVAPSEFLGTCHAKFTQSTVAKSYADPVTTNIQLGGTQAVNPFYNVKNFEQITHYIQRIEGMPDSPDEAARVSYAFSPTTTWYKELTFPLFSPVSVPGCALDLPIDPTITYFEGVIDYTGVNYSDRYGSQWPLVIRPTGVFYTGNKLISAIDFGGEKTIVYVDPIKEFNSMEAGTNWIWNVQGINQYEIRLFYQAKADPVAWQTLIEATGNPTDVRFSDGRDFDSGKLDSYKDFTAAELKLMGLKGGLGYLIDKMWLAVELERPSVIINDTEGDSLTFAQNLKVEYAPIILKTDPAPIAYHHKDKGSKIVDQTQGLEDHDPTTCQNFEETDLQELQDLTTGNTVEVTLPFCKDGQECLSLAKTLFDYMSHENTQTYTLTCGPDDDPELGVHVNGFPADVRIENISYSFQDGSSYTIEVSLGPVFANIGSWNNSGWIRKVEDVTRKAIIIWVAGDSVNYRVYVRGLGYFNAINSLDTVFYVGEIVEVTVFNIPVEE